MRNQGISVKEFSYTWLYPSSRKGGSTNELKRNKDGKKPE